MPNKRVFFGNGERFIEEMAWESAEEMGLTECNNSDGMNIYEISEVLGLSPARVHQILQKTLKKMRKIMIKNNPDIIDYLR